MLKLAKVIALALYGVVGAFGWYQYERTSAQLNSINKVDNLSANMTANYVRAIVWYHSRGKLQELRAILLNDDLSKRELIEVRIKNMLMHRTSAYILELNNLNTPVKNVGTWYQDNFDFDNFFAKVYQVVFDPVLTVEDKIRNITDIMEEYQSISNRKLTELLNKPQGVPDES
ncbi:MAG: hypothetical protein XXXJIFNMEKO3_00250 [Candidatus Erwinia impunctatus]|nr:hypothetical protein XXXJIFNMEKO_00250 [Culicoides impunctatus]